MKRIKYSQIINEDRKKANTELQVKIRATRDTDIKMVSTKPPRSMSEIVLLYRAIKKKELSFIQEGKLVKNGRRWKLSF